MAGLPKYRKVYETLRRGLAEGRYEPGGLLPSENELCRTFGTTRPTIRKALDILTAEGFIVRQQGKGSIVKGTSKEIGILSLKSTTSAMSGSSMETKLITGPELRQWEEAFSFPISEQEKRAGCIYFERLRIIDGAPLILDVTMLPNIGLPRFISYDLNDVSLFELLRTKYNIDVTGGTQQLFALPADKRIPTLLNGRPCYAAPHRHRHIETSPDGCCFTRPPSHVPTNYAPHATSRNTRLVTQP